jgi:DNA-binding transcriptional LysR family regulator
LLDKTTPMQLRHVELFCDVVALRSFSKAAAAHELAQSSASQAVLHLEERLGTKLIDRSKRPLEPTPAGEVYFEGCRNLLNAFRGVEDRVRAMENKVTGEVRVAAIYSVGLLQLDRIVRRFRESYPEADVSVDYRHPDEVRERILSGKADLGLVSFPKETSDLACLPWLEQEVGLVVPADHELAGWTTVTPADLSGLRMVGFPPELTIRRETDRWLARHGVEVTVVHEFDTVENVKRDVEVGSGAALLPLATVTREIEIGSLAAIPIDTPGDPLVRPLGIVHDKHHALSSAAARFVELLRDLAGDSPPTAAAASTDDTAEDEAIEAEAPDETADVLA